jgi:choline-phosphate cytidylyltransferase
MRKVITYGTFDLFHKGHYNILKRAKEEGDYLIVGVTGESYDAERGKLSVQDSLATRIENVKKTGFADKIIVEEYLGQKIPDIIKYNVDVLVIGSDWKGKFDHLSKYCEIKYLERTKDISSTQLREENLTIYKFGIVTDDLNDNDAVLEPKAVSGIHLESVFSPDKAVADGFCDKFELDKGYTDYEEFLDSVDIVYIKTARGSRIRYIEEALEHGKHVVCDAPFSLDKEECRRVWELAESKRVNLVENVATNYLQAFGQLMWQARGNLIGDLISIKCSISKHMFSDASELDFYDLSYYPVCGIIKILGPEFTDCHCKLVKNEQGEISYGMINIEYDNSVSSIEVGMDVDVDAGLQIFGTTGTIFVPSDWWRIGYFEVKQHGESQFKRYCSNFEGNGFRYLIQALLIMIRAQGDSANRITFEESQAILSVLDNIEGN